MIDVTRREAAPASLAANDRYDGADVVEALHADFLGKCYLCETKVEPGTFTNQSPEAARPRAVPRAALRVDEPLPHLQHTQLQRAAPASLPRRGAPRSGRRSSRRGAHRAASSTRRRCSPARIRAFVFEAIREDDTAAANTAEELARIHAGTGSSPPAQRTAGALRGTILAHVKLIAQKLA